MLLSSTSTRRPTPARPATRRRGVASVMAMLFLVIFSALSLGFYSATTMSAQMAQNERTTLNSQIAAESGLNFLRYHLSALDIPAGLESNKMFEEVFQQLRDRLDPTANLSMSQVGYVPQTATTPATISIPETGYISINPQGSQKFRIILTNAGDLLEAKVIGRSGSSALSGRGVLVRFQKANNATEIFNFGVASRGTISTTGTSTVTGLTDAKLGSILSTNQTSATPVSIFGKEVSGDISVVSSTANVAFGAGVKIGGTNNSALIRSAHIHKGVPEPRFPDVDTTVYKQYATNIYAGGDYLENVVIPANTNRTFNSATIRGVVYVELPNSLAFSGTTDMQGVIVVKNNPASVNDSTSPVDMVKNVLDFSGNVVAKPIQDLPASFGDVRKLTGAFIIAPGFRVRMWGNFGTVGGSIIASQFQMGGSAEGTVRGSIIQTNDQPTTIDGSADVVIASVGTTEYPPGVTFGVHYTTIPGTYLEVPVMRNE